MYTLQVQIVGFPWNDVKTSDDRDELIRIVEEDQKEGAVKELLGKRMMRSFRILNEGGGIVYMR